MAVDSILIGNGGTDTSGVTATQSDVLSPKIFIDENGDEKQGTMQKITADSGTNLQADGYNVDLVNLYLRNQSMNNKYLDGVEYLYKPVSELAGALGVDASKMLDTATACGVQGTIPIKTPDVLDQTPALQVLSDAYYVYFNADIFNKYVKDINWVRSSLSDVLYAVGACRKATGTVSAATGTGQITYRYIGSTITNQVNYFTISGLGFTPSIVKYYGGVCNGSGYMKNSNSSGDVGMYPTQTYVCLTSGGFTIPYLGTGTWEAYE